MVILRSAPQHLRWPRLILDSSLESECLGARPVNPDQPGWAPQIVGSGSGPRPLHPSAILFMRFVRINEDISIAVLLSRAGDGNFLVPAMLTADGIGLHGKNQILMHARVFPGDAGRISITARKAANPMQLMHLPLSRTILGQINQCR